MKFQIMINDVTKIFIFLPSIKLKWMYDLDGNYETRKKLKRIRKKT